MPTDQHTADAKTRSFSIRLTDSEQKRIRAIAKRLRSSESAVIRYGIRSMLKRTAPLSEPDTSAYSLLPVFVEYGEELISYFDLDVSSLDRVINGNTQGKEHRIEAADLALLSASGLGEPHVHAKLREIQLHEVEPGETGTMLRAYLYKKYIYGVNNGAATGAASGNEDAAKSAPVVSATFTPERVDHHE